MSTPFPFLAIGAASLLTLPSVEFAQSSDDCTTPQAITGNGPFAFDTIGATTDGSTDPG